MDVPFPAPGETFASKYRIDSELGRGGFARVYKATRLDLETFVAIKAMRPHMLLNGEPKPGQGLEDLMARFKQEAKTISQLRSLETVNMHDYGRTDDGMLYMVLEYIDGRTLGEVIQEEKALSPERVIHIVEQVARGLHEAHSLGVLHRDIKPGNIMLYEHLGQKDLVKVLDFGIGKVIGQAGGLTQNDLTADNRLLGTPRYLPPEYIRNAELTPASDIYSLGLVTFELLTGKHAFEATSSVQMIGQHLDPAPFTLPEDHDVPDGLRQIVHKMAVKDPTQRYQSAQELLADLGAYKDGGRVDVGLREQSARQVTSPETKLSEVPDVDYAGPATGLVWGMGLAMAVLALVLVYVFWVPGGEPAVIESDAVVGESPTAPAAEPRQPRAGKEGGADLVVEPEEVDSKSDEPTSDTPEPNEPGTDEPGTDEPVRSRLSEEAAPDEPPSSPKRDSPKKEKKPAEKKPAEKEPAKREPAKREPAKREPAKREPAKREPAKREPASKPADDTPSQDKPLYLPVE